MTHALPQRIVPFYGDELVAVQQPDGTVFVLFGRLCDNLGLNQQAQVRRLERHAVLAPALVMLDIPTSGGVQALQCLKVSLLPLWLSGVQVRRVKPALQARLVLYQQEAADILWQAFKHEIVVNNDAFVPQEDDPSLQQLQRIVEMGRAIMQMAEQQIGLQRQQQTLARRVDTAAGVIKGMQGQLAHVDVRLNLLEDQLQPSAYVSDTQATEVSNQVKALAYLLTGTEKGGNHYQGIFAELYRRFGVSSYKLIRQEQYEAVLQFLEDWRQGIAP
ncbi:MAG: hypothetical protein NVS2B7_37810 [Herpetosiphon sp.]